MGLLASVVLVGCGSGSSQTVANQSPAVPVTTIAVARRDVPVELRAIGSVVPFATVEVKAQVSGQLAAVRFQEGQEVKQGDLLFVVDERPFTAALREAEAKLAQDRAGAVNAASEAGRFSRLAKGGIVSTSDDERVRASALSARAAVQADEAAVETARLRLQYTRLTAPIDGRIGAILVHQGNVVKENETTLAVINQTRPVHVEFAVPQAELPGIRRHMSDGQLVVEAAVTGADAPVTGTLKFVDNTVDTATATVRLKALFANDGEPLWPGQFVNVTLRLAVQHDALVIPARAIQTGQSGRFVYVVGADRTVTTRPVEAGAVVGAEVVVGSGLAAGEEIVTDGQLRLAPGMRVETAAATAPAA